MKQKVSALSLLALMAQTSLATATNLPAANHRGVAGTDGLVFVAATKTPTATKAGTGKVLVSFEEPDSAQGWTAVNDGVMGGISQGDFKRTEAGTLMFSGNLSLEKNGGFTSIRSKPASLDLSGMVALAVKAKGDGRTYWVDLRVTQQMRASSYRAYLPTTAGEWKETLIPLEDFKLQAFGRELASTPIKLSEVESIGFTLSDKKAGPFTFELASVTAVAGGDSPAKSGAAKNIVEVAQQAGSFNTLLAAATAADLAGALSGEGPFTVFAPTDEAFAKLPKGTVNELLKPENRAQLAALLKYHVIPGRVSLAKALEVGEAATLQGAKVSAKFVDGRVRIGPANLLTADLPASNGIIHVIDQVLVPPTPSDRPLDAIDLIQLAIERGVPLFNEGNPGACAAVYEITCESLRALPDLPKNSRAELSRALDEMRAEKNDRRKAWILREAIDVVATTLATR